MAEEEKGFSIEKLHQMMDNGGVIKEDIPTEDETSIVEEPQAPQTPEDPIEGENPLIKAETPIDPEFFKTNFEGYEDLDSVKKALVLNKETEEKASKYETLLQEAESAKATLEEYKTSNVYQDDDLYRLSKIKGDKDKYEVTTKLLYGSALPEDILKMEFINKHPEYKDKPDEVQRLVMSKYHVDLKEEKDDIDGEVIEANVQINKDRKQLAMDRMKLDAATARESLLTEFNSIEIPEPKTPKTKDELKKVEEEKLQLLVDQWKDPFAAVTESFTKMNFSQSVGENEIPIEIELTKDEQMGLAKMTADIITNQHISPTPENIASVKQIAINAFKAENTARIVTEAVNYAMSQSDETWRSKVHNSNPDVNTDKPIESESKKIEEAYHKLFNLDKK